MTFNIYFTMRGPGGEKEIPNLTNPVVSDNLQTCLASLSERIPDLSNLGVQVTGIRVEVLDAEEQG